MDTLNANKTSLESRVSNFSLIILDEKIYLSTLVYRLMHSGSYNFRCLVLLNFISFQSDSLSSSVYPYPG